MRYGIDFYVALYLQNIVLLIDTHTFPLILTLFYMFLMIHCEVKDIMRIKFMMQRALKI